MDAINTFFKTAAENINLPDFFKSSTLSVNNFFLTIVAFLSLVALLLVIFLVPVKKKAKQVDKTPDEKAAPVAEKKSEPAPAPVQQTKPVQQAPIQPSKPVQPAPAPTPVIEKNPEPAPVEEKKSEPAPTKKPAPAPAPVKEATDDTFRNGGKYEIVKRKGSFYFLLKANNGQLLLESTSYTTEAGARSGIDTFKNAVEVGEFNIDEDKNGNFKFILRASARSQMLYYGESYGTRQSAENAIQSVKKFAFKSIVRRAEENDEGGAEEVAGVLALKPLKASDHKLGGKYEIIERAGSYYFLLKANNGQLLVESPAFTTEAGARSGIDTFKKAAESGIFMIDCDKNGNYRFILRASARSQLRYFGESYSTKQSAENSVNSLRCFAQNAVLK